MAWEGEWVWVLGSAAAELARRELAWAEALVWLAPGSAQAASARRESVWLALAWEQVAWAGVVWLASPVLVRRALGALVGASAS